MLKDLWQDLRYGVRMLLKYPGFTCVAVLTLALGVGANTAIFQLLDAVRLRALPVRAPQELAEVRMADMRGARGGIGRSPSVTNPIWEQVREHQQTFDGVFAWGTDGVNLAPGGEVRPARMLYVSGDFFSTLGVGPELGRVFTNEDDRRGCGEPGLVISHEFWQREYGGERAVVGRRLTLADHPFEIVGVTPAGFFGMEVGRSFDLALPLCAVPLVRGNNNYLSGNIWWLTVTGRLRPGRSLEQAGAEMRALSPGLFEAALPANYPPASVKDYLASRLTAVPAGAGASQLREKYGQALWLLLSIAGLVLLIACANLANLLLARASAREREIAVRRALGASRGRVVRQLLAESLLLAALGACAGAWLAQVLSEFLVAFLSTSADPVFLDLSLDWRVLGFAAGLAVLTCLLFGLAPAMRATRTEPGALMKSGGRRVTAGRERFSLRRALVVAQVALSLALVAGALLFSRSLGNLLTVETGFRQEGVLIANVGFQRLKLPPERVPAFKDEVFERVRAIPGVALVEATVLRERLLATLSGFFGGLALLLACVGLYGLLSYGVASRTNEIGIRMALGAGSGAVLWLILREALGLVVVGVAVGVPLVFAVTRLASTLLYGLTPTDPVSLLGAALLMLAVALVAGYLPSRRATRVDPLAALRCE